MKSIAKEFLLRTKQIKWYPQNECQILKSMKNQFIIKMHYAFQTPSYSEGGDLSMHIEERQIFDESETKFYIAELILAIEYLHSNNIIYHDLKPENILLGKDGHIKLSDFGLAKQMYGQDPSPALTFCGNSAYLSPEMLLKKGANKPLDVHGIGTILYELLVGFAPYYDEY